jgi:hypothetical protein
MTMSRFHSDTERFWTGYKYPEKGSAVSVDPWDLITNKKDISGKAPSRCEPEIDYESEGNEGKDLILFDPFSTFMMLNEAAVDYIKTGGKKEPEEEEKPAMGRPFGTTNLQRQRPSVRTPKQNGNAKTKNVTDHNRTFERKRDGAGREPRK